jgi:peptide chain release factor
MDTWVHITSGQGPDECCWVVARLLDVLRGEAAAAGLAVRVLETVAGDQPGTFRSVLLTLEGPEADAFLDGYRGTVQWLGRSPYRPRHKRKNWFVGVECLTPPAKPSWSEDELRIDVMLSSGPGGQHVNKTCSAVRLTHVPTGLTVIAREERSQQHNRKLALARLAQLFEDRQAEAQGQVQKRRWQQHQALVRGNAVRVYEGPDFRLRKG